ncbi:AtpZ/AtpI family protein [Micropruina sp.]|uniref:AtpZ/AtpI family protein n=1 Tax=Micropruina sp. TaxID=2737536 RepID=UPI0039E5D3D3
MEQQRGTHETVRSGNGMNSTDEGVRSVSYLIAGVLLYGGVGWLLDRWLGTVFLLPLGIVLGAAGGVYLIHQRFVRNS